MTAGTHPPSVSGARPGVVLAMMACVSVLNVMDRQLLAVLIEPIKRDLGVSDTAMGLLSGTSFALLHVAASLPIATWADRGERRSIIALGLALWSGLTVLTGYARSFGEIFAIRVGVGIGEATGGGPAQSLLSDTFPPSRRSTAMAVLVMGGPIGSMVAFGLGGWLGETFGWRMAFVIFGAPGLLLALLIRLRVPEPVRGVHDTPRSADEEGGAPDVLERIAFLDAARFVLQVPSLRAFVLAAPLNTVGIYTIMVWSVPYLDRVHALDMGEAGARLAIASGLFTALGTLAGGPLGDRLAARDPRWLGWLPAAASFSIAPFGIGFALAPDADFASLLLAPASFMAGLQFAPIYAAVQTLVAPQMRALSGAFITALNTLLGLGLAPPLVGLMNDLGAAQLGTETIRYSIALMMLSHVGAAVLLVVATRRLVRDLGARERFLGSAT